MEIFAEKKCNKILTWALPLDAPTNLMVIPHNHIEVPLTEPFVTNYLATPPIKALNESQKVLVHFLNSIHHHNMSHP